MDSDNHPSSPVVLLVEDELMLRVVARDMLEFYHFSVLEASTADEALCILERRSDIAVIFTDVDMPGSMNGFALAAQAAERWPHIRLVITSGRYWPDNDELPDNGQFLHKPYRMKQLISAIEHAA